MKIDIDKREMELGGIKINISEFNDQIAGTGFYIDFVPAGLKLKKSKLADILRLIVWSETPKPFKSQLAKEIRQTMREIEKNWEVIAIYPKPKTKGKG